MDASSNGKMDVTINGKAITLKYKTGDFTIKDWKELEREGLTFETIKEAKVSQVALLVHQVVKKSDSTITMDDIDALSLEALKDILAFAQATVTLDRPT
jgi:hypothetical protein